MRENVRNVSRGRAGRERWEFALDNRQIAAVAVGALVIVGSSFVLGMNTGKSMARQAKPAAANSLDAFDAAHENLPTPPEPKHWEYEKLGGNKPADAGPATSPQARATPAAQPPPARPASDAPPVPAPGAATAATVAPAAASTDAAPQAPAEPPRPAPGATAAPVSPAAKPVAPSPAAASPAKSAKPATHATGSSSAMDRAVAAVSGGTPRTPVEAPGPKSAAKPPPAGGYVIQVGASRTRAEADRIAKKFASHGARVVAADVDGKRWYRVRLASTTYADRDEAERALARLSRETGARGFVTPAR